MIAKNQFTLDYQQKILDLTYEQMTTLDIEENVEQVIVLVLTGNPLQTYNFIEKFVNLEILHMDNIQLNSFTNLPLSSLISLKYLILRLNEVQDFENLQSNESLQHIDLSLNLFNKNCESTFQASFPSLKRMQFGFIQEKQQEYYDNTKLLTNSNQQINSFKLFNKVFVQRFYDTSDQYFQKNDQEVENTAYAIINGIMFKLQVNQNKLLIISERIGEVDENEYFNKKCIITCFNILVGYDTHQTLQQIIQLKYLDCKNSDLFNLNMRSTFSYNLQQYPTQESNNSESDIAAFKLLKQKQQDQYFQQNTIKIVTVEYDLKIAVFCFQVNGQHTNVQKICLTATEYQNLSIKKPEIKMIPFDQLLQLQENQFEAIAGYQVEVQVTDQYIQNNNQTDQVDFETINKQMTQLTQITPQQQNDMLNTNYDKNHNVQQSNEKQAQSLEQTVFKENQHILSFNLQHFSVNKSFLVNPIEIVNFVHVYVSIETKNQLINRLQQLFKQIMNVDIGQPDKLIRDAIIQFNSQQNSIIEVQNEQTRTFSQQIILKIKYNNQYIPYSVKIAKIGVQSKEDEFQIENQCYKRYIIAECYLKNYKQLLMITNNVKKQIQITKLELFQQSHYLITKYFTTENNVYIESRYQNVNIIFYRNNVIIQEGKERHFNLKLLQGYFEGLYKAVVQVFNDEQQLICEIFSEPLFLKKNDSQLIKYIQNDQFEEEIEEIDETEDSEFDQLDFDQINTQFLKNSKKPINQLIEEKKQLGFIFRQRNKAITYTDVLHNSGNAQFIKLVVQQENQNYVLKEQEKLQQKQNQQSKQNYLFKNMQESISEQLDAENEQQPSIFQLVAFKITEQNSQQITLEIKQLLGSNILKAIPFVKLVNQENFQLSMANVKIVQSTVSFVYNVVITFNQQTDIGKLLYLKFYVEGEHELNQLVLIYQSRVNSLQFNNFAHNKEITVLNFQDQIISNVENLNITNYIEISYIKNKHKRQFDIPINSLVLHSINIQNCVLQQLTHKFGEQTYETLQYQYQTQLIIKLFSNALVQQNNELQFNDYFMNQLIMLFGNSVKQNNFNKQLDNKLFIITGSGFIILQFTDLLELQQFIQSLQQKQGVLNTEHTPILQINQVQQLNELYQLKRVQKQSYLQLLDQINISTLNNEVVTNQQQILIVKKPVELSDTLFNTVQLVIVNQCNNQILQIITPKIEQHQNNQINYSFKISNAFSNNALYVRTQFKQFLISDNIKSGHTDFIKNTQQFIQKNNFAFSQDYRKISIKLSKTAIQFCVNGFKQQILFSVLSIYLTDKCITISNGYQVCVIEVEQEQKISELYQILCQKANQLK